MKSILIANRGEIAIRIIKTAKKMGIKTYVIKTPKEPSAMYLEFADEVVEFVPSTEGIPEFLDIEGIIDVAKKFKIEAVHPGYGFLAESPYFAQRCEEEKIIYIGPSPDAIYKMGNKTIAKQLAKKYNVPMVEGSPKNLKDVNEALAIAEKIGYPVIIKAAAGGGGRGMRIVEKAEDMEKMFNMASNEAAKAFNDPSIFMEKYVCKPRHIEFQVLGDKHGNIVHLGERECSIQRKHQKLIEEAPSIALDENLRKKMGESAIQIARSVNYFSAGTVEFLLDAAGNYYFMEMNTRIQVEHPVTELITGLDLIEQMIRVARGEKLSFTQEDVKIKGWAIECRINAEDVQSNFSPNLGIIEKLSMPEGKNIRIDTGIREGSEITPFFDSMIAKLIVYGKTREEAIDETLKALDNFRIKGLKTTIPFFKALLLNRKFRKGDINTSFIGTEMKSLFYTDATEELLAAFMACYDYSSELKYELDAVVDYDKGQSLSPWILNKRMKSL